MSQKISVDVGFAILTAEVLTADAKHPEISITMEDKTTGEVLQDIVLVRPALNEQLNLRTNNAVDCIVWADANDEDYTHKFLIRKYVAEEE